MYVNLDILKTYSDGDNEFLLEMINKFNADIPKVLDNMEKALQESDWENLKQIAHKMIGTTGVFYITDVTPHLQKIEQICGNDPSKEKLQPLVEKVKEICKSAMEELEQEKAQL